MTLEDPIVILGSARTPIGGFQRDLRVSTAPELGAAVIRATLDRIGIGVDAVEETVFGYVLPAGQGQAPARDRGWLTVCHGSDHRQQVVPFGNEGRHVGT
ncbi:acetyl-CoA acetyltransferase [Rhizobium sp. BK313]|nr:acetyl-CoA acetyltransferase [Rhizobium sp. BK313]